MIETHKLGRKGEDIAAQFLAKKKPPYIRKKLATQKSRNRPNI